MISKNWLISCFLAHPTQNKTAEHPLPDVKGAEIFTGETVIMAIIILFLISVLTVFLYKNSLLIKEVKALKTNS